MMYQFQRSFIKAASESVDVYGPVPEEEPHFPGAASPLCSQAVSWPAGQGWSWARLLLGVTRGGGGGSTGLGETVTVTISCC